MKKHIPNIITLCNLACGAVAAWQASKGELQLAALFVLLGILFDFFDGLTARLLNVPSPLGKELDSMADLVTSGVAPGFILAGVLERSGCTPWNYLALLLPVFAGYRLAKFNLDTRQSHSFLGLPAPACALVWVSVGLLFDGRFNQIAIVSLDGIRLWLFGTSTGLILLLVLCVVTCVLMITEIPLFALKVKNLSWADNRVRYIFLIVTVVLILLLGVFSFPAIIMWYIILSILAAKHV